MPPILFRATLFILGTAGMAGCSSVEPVAPYDGPITDPTQLYASLTIDHPAINLSTASDYNTIQLTATPRDARGTPMLGLPAPTFYSTDTANVKVTPDGLVTAIGVVSGVYVVAELTVPGPIRHLDSAQVNVQDLPTPPTLKSLSIHPLPPDSAIWAAQPRATGASAFIPNLGPFLHFTVPRDGGIIVPRAVDMADNPIPGLAIEYTSLDPKIAMIDRWSHLVNSASLQMGQVRIVARTTAYGITKADTATFTVTPPWRQDVVSQLGSGGASVFAPSEVWVATGGTVVWVNYLGDSVDVTFDDPTNVVMPSANICSLTSFLTFLFGPGPTGSGVSCDGTGDGAGDILLPMWVQPLNPEKEGDGSAFTMRLRRFTVPGVYPFHSTRTGATGRIVVAGATSAGS